MAIDATVQWLASGAAIIFLIVCAWHNRRNGYQRVRAEESLVDDAILWLARRKESVSSADDGFSIASQRSTPSIMNTEAAQLVQLNSALRQYGRLASPCQPSEIGDRTVPIPW